MLSNRLSSDLFLSLKILAYTISKPTGEVEKYVCGRGPLFTRVTAQMRTHLHKSACADVDQGPRSARTEHAPYCTAHKQGVIGSRAPAPGRTGLRAATVNCSRRPRPRSSFIFYPSGKIARISFTIGFFILHLNTYNKKDLNYIRNRNPSRLVSNIM